MDSFFKIKIPLTPSIPHPPPTPPISMLNLAKFSCHQPKTSQTTLNMGKGVFHEKRFFKFVSKVLSKIVDFDLSVFYAKILKIYEQNNKRLKTFLANKEETKLLQRYFIYIIYMFCFFFIY